MGLRLIWCCLALCFQLDTASADVVRFSPFDDVGTAKGTLSYTNASAPSSGTLRLGSTVNFDSTNFMRFPGRAPHEMRHAFDTLLVPVRDQTAVFYGLLAKDLDIADDFSFVRFHLEPVARWHDGRAVTAEDVAFTFQSLRAHGLPRYRNALRNIDIEIKDAHTITFKNRGARSWRYIELLGTFPIQSKAFWSARAVGDITLDIPLGSGPYRVSELSFNREMVLERVEDYWAADHPVNQGRWNFDEIVVSYFFDETALIEAVKSGRLDVRREFSAAAWDGRYDGDALSSNRIVKTTLPRADAGALHTLVINQRRPPFDDIRVREALGLLFDTQWYLDLFGGAYDAPGSFYGDTPFAAIGSASAAERTLLAQFAEQSPQGAVDSPAPQWPEQRRQRMRRANALLDEAEFELRGGVRINPITGDPWTVEFVTAHRASVERLEPYRKALEQVGIQLDLRAYDYVSGRRLILDHEYDLTLLTWQASIPPGVQETWFWHSDQAGPHGYGLGGLNNPAVDYMIDQMQVAKDLEDLQAAARAFDRLMRWGHYVVPMWHNASLWYVHGSDLRIPVGGHVETDPIVHWWRAPPPDN
ncbi:extracellular solute-binding protein [Tateyamaria sp. syn59]|uniref:extracellular solute-binding protein n=1 Tax=Tateyamaria sp. syn59 TaxID=2576942 RepID=UPI0011BD7322|nr:extracellular solute-binding protein [Tateyamaria sp. syn59]